MQRCALRDTERGGEQRELVDVGVEPSAQRPDIQRRARRERAAGHLVEVERARPGGAGHAHMHPGIERERGGGLVLRARVEHGDLAVGAQAQRDRRRADRDRGDRERAAGRERVNGVATGRRRGPTRGGHCAGQVPHDDDAGRARAAVPGALRRTTATTAAIGRGCRPGAGRGSVAPAVRAGAGRVTHGAVRAAATTAAVRDRGSGDARGRAGSPVATG